MIIPYLDQDIVIMIQEVICLVRRRPFIGVVDLILLLVGVVVRFS